MKLELLLKGIDQMSPVIKKQSPLLRQLDKDALKTLNTLKKLFNFKPKGNLSGFGKPFVSESQKINAEISKLKKSFQSIGNVKIKSPKITVPSVSTAGNDFPKVNTDKARRELDKLYGGKSNKYLSRLVNLNERVLEPAAAVKNVWREQYDSLKQYTDETSKLLRLQGRFKQMNLGEADNRKMFAAVEQNTRNVRGISLSDSMDIASNLFNALNSVDATIASLETASKYSVAMRALYKDKFTPEQINEQVLQGYKFVELTGATKDRAMMEDRFNVLSKVVSSTGGEVTMAKFLGLGKQASPIMQTITSKGVMNTAAAIDTFGGERVGTALSALNRAWVGSIMPAYIAERYQKLGLIKEGGVEYNKAGKLTRVRPGANVLGDAFLQDPLEATKLLTKAIHDYAATPQGKKEYKDFDLSTPKGMNQAMRGLFGTETQYRLANEFINNLSQVEKESSRAEKSEGAVDSYNRLAKENSGLLKIEEYEAAIKNFRAEVGKPLIEIGTKITSSLIPLLQLAAEHPTLTQFALATILVSKGINGIGQTASILNSATGLTSFFRNSTAAANSTTTAIGNTSNAINGLKGRNIPVGVQIASVLGIDLFIRLIEKEIGIALNARAAQADAVKASQTNANAFQNAKKDGTKFSQNDIDSQANTAWFSAMNLGLKDSLRSETLKKPFWSFSKDSMLSQSARETFLYPLNSNSFQAGGFSGFFKARQNNIPYMAEGFKKNTGILEDPQVMLSFLKQLPARVGDKGEQQGIRQSLEMAFPESYKQASAQLAEQAGSLSQSLLNLVQPSADLGTGFSNLNTNSNNAVTGVNNFANAANSAAMRINGIEIIPPTFQPIQIPIFGQSPNPATGTIPGRAKGGSVRKGYQYRINEVGQEFFTPDKSGSIISNDILRRNRVAASSGVHISFNPTVTVNSDNPNAKEITDSVNRELAKFRSELAALANPDRLAQKVEMAAQRDAERL